MDHRARYRRQHYAAALSVSALALVLAFLVDIEPLNAVGLVGVICAYAGFNYALGVKQHVLNETFKPLLDAGIDSRELDTAHVMLAYGNYRSAIMKLKFVAMQYPEREDLKDIIRKLESHVGR